jgi:DNA polymerase III alpha subunit (gram-positive type)
MFSINSGVTNNNCTIIILICVVIFYLFFINLNTSSCYIKSTESVNAQKDKEYIKEIISKQEKILLDLQNKIEKKLEKKKSSRKIQNPTTSRINVISNINKIKSNTIESLDGSVELSNIVKSSKTSIDKHNKLAKIKSIKSKQESDESTYKKYFKQHQPQQHKSQHQPQHQPQYPHHPTNPHYNPYPPMIPSVHRQTDPMYIRDNQVLNDKLYPPLGRTERPTADLLMNFINNQPDLFNMNTRGPPDTFRPIGYLTRKDGDQTIDSTLILFGRAKYPNSDLGEFYVTSSNKMSDIKVPILQNNSNIKKITDVPNDVDITGNLFNGKYAFTELPKPDFPTPYM